MDLLNIGVILQLLALMAWTGGIFVLLFARGGSVFSGIDDAQEIAGRMLRRFNGVEVIAGLVLLTGGGMLYLADVETRYVTSNLCISGVMYAVFITYGFGISQRMELLRARLHEETAGTPDGRDSRSLALLTRACTVLMSVNLLLGIAQVVLLVHIVTRVAEPAMGDDGSMNLYGSGGFGAF